MAIVKLDDFRKKAPVPAGCTSFSAEYREALALTLTGWTLVGLGWWFMVGRRNG